MQNKVVLITGISRGLGFALTQHWKSENTVIGLGRSPIDRPSKAVHFYSCNLANQEETIVVIRRILSDFPEIDMLINNAGVLTSVPVGLINVDDISRMIDVNLKAPILISKMLFRKMVQMRKGQIINILSMAPKMSLTGDAVYSATKSGLEAFSRVLNREGHTFGVHVNNIGLTAFPTGMLDQIIKRDTQKMFSIIPHRQFAPLDEVIAAIEFFEKNNNDIGGQTLYFGGV